MNATGNPKGRPPVHAEKYQRSQARKGLRPKTKIMAKPACVAFLQWFVKKGKMYNVRIGGAIGLPLPINARRR
jgi:hypothetical protein